ncbi:alpha/beta fold hydrolase [Nocardia sp. NPDC049190]|uniref:alpha/beta fold hydrolase n=1 Tax=Nocardia sp. NPDC049190 TaxID=3155650 RepID=UPI0033F280E5
MDSATQVDVNGRRARIFAQGDRHESPILLLHGIGRSLEDWAPQFPHYRQAGYRLIAPDLPGSGFSDRLPTATTLRALAQGVIETLDALGEVSRLHVMGNSLGGAVALQLLALQPDRVATLVLADSAGFGSELHPMMRLVATPVIGSVAARYTATRASARMTERLLYVDQSFATEARIEHALKIARHTDAGVILHETAQILGTSRGVRPEWRTKLLAEVSNHPRPTLIVWGDRDRILPMRQLEAAHRLLPHARVHLFEGIGHMPQIEAEDEFAELTLDFLRSTATAQR